MAVRSEQRGSATVVWVDEAELTGKVVDPLRQEIDRAIENRCHRIVLDLRHAILMESFFLAMLVSVHKELSAQQGELKIVGLSESLLKIFIDVRFDKIFAVYGSVGEAVQAFEERDSGR